MVKEAPRERAARRALARAGGEFLRRYPHHAGIAARWVPEAAAGAGSVGVTFRNGDLILLFDPDFVLAHREYLVGILHHEVNHVLFGHLRLPRTRFSDTSALRIATEVTVNEHVPEPLPGRPMRLEDYGLPPDEDTVTRYERLVARPPGGEHAPEPSPMCNHDGWPGAEQAEAARRARDLRYRSLLRRRVDRALARGSGPGASASRVQVQVAAGAAAGVDWRRVLEPHLVTELEPSFARPSRRRPRSIGIVPGTRRIDARARILAAVDTSSSVSEAAFATIAAELSVLARDHTVIVVECDTRVGRVYEFSGKLENISGRGGTDLRPPFEVDLLDRIGAEIAIYFTDGRGRAPGRAPAIPVIWCLTSRGVRPAPWGDEVRLAGAS
jgi:predicted metal-dependent peptidase